MRKWFNVVAILAMLAGFVFPGNVSAQDAVGDDGGTLEQYVPGPLAKLNAGKGIDQPNPYDYKRNLARMSQMRAGEAAEASALALTGEDRVLVLLVEFAGTDTFPWTAGTSTWDPIGKADASEYTGFVGDCSGIAGAVTGDYTYTGPLHNEIPRPLSADDASGNAIWTEDFSPDWFKSFMFGNGMSIEYTREDSSQMKETFVGQSVRDFYSDLSSGQYTINGDVIGWLALDHSSMYYDADQCPGARSTSASVQRGGLIPGAGNARTLVRDALDKVNEQVEQGLLPGFDWTDYDQNGDGIIDRLWVVHAGYGEEDSPTLLNRTDYGEGAVWSHSSSVTPAYVVDAENDISAGPYIIMPENGGIGVFAHEYGHNLGAADLYAYNAGETSAGFWTTMADDWTGFPIAYEPPSMDPMHLDWWGWLDPTVISDPSQVYEVKIGQASRYPDGSDMTRAVRIDLPDGQLPQSVPVWQGDHYWWGGKGDLMNSMMQTITPITIPADATNASLNFDLVYDIEPLWDFLWVQASTDDGASWTTLTNANTICSHDSSWIGQLYGFPDDLCAAGVGGFSGYNGNWPDPEAQVMDLSAFAGESILVRFWYMTDWGTVYTGPFIDNVSVTADSNTLFSDDAEGATPLWAYLEGWELSDGNVSFPQSLYFQWRNTHENGGYDSALGDTRWRYGEANTGLLAWYNNGLYTDNEVFSYLSDGFSFGPKGMMLVVDAQPEPYRFPSKVASYPNEGANLNSRGLMRDATFTLEDTVDFVYPDGATSPTFEGRPAVKTFHDSLGYYPGLEYAPRGPLQTASRWMTAQWDSSVVMPSTDSYAVKAPGYVGTGGTVNQEVRFACSVNQPSGLLGCYWFGSGIGLGYDGGNGNPADVDSQYGWHVELVEQADDYTWGKVRIWNSAYAVDTTLAPAQSKLMPKETTTVTAAFKNTGSAASFLACAAIDTEKVTYVAGSATGSPLLLAECPVAVDAAQPLATGEQVGALAWYLNGILPGETAQFTYQVKAVGEGEVEQNPTILNLTTGKALYTSLTEKPLVVNFYKSYLPFTGKTR